MQRTALSLLELLIGMVVVAILSTTIFISLAGTTDDADNAKVVTLQSQLQAELDIAYAVAVQQSQGAWLDLPADAWRVAEARPARPAPIATGVKGTEPMPPAADPPDMELLTNLYANVQKLDAKYGDRGLCAVYTAEGLKALVLGEDHPEIEETRDDPVERLLVAVDISSVMRSASAYLGSFGSVPSPTPMGLSEHVDDWLLFRLREVGGSLELRAMQLSAGGSSFDAYVRQASENISPLDYAIMATLLGQAGVTLPSYKESGEDGVTVDIPPSADFFDFIDAVDDWNRSGLYFNTDSLVETSAKSGGSAGLSLGSLYDTEQVFSNLGFLEQFSQAIYALDNGDKNLTMEELGFSLATSTRSGVNDRGQPVSVTVETVYDFYGNVITEAVSTPQSWGTEVVEHFYNTLDQSDPLGTIVYQYDQYGRLLNRDKDIFDPLTHTSQLESDYSATYHGTGSQVASESWHNARPDGYLYDSANTYDAQGNQLSHSYENVNPDGSRRVQSSEWNPDRAVGYDDGRVHIYDQQWDASGELVYEYLQDYDAETGQPEYYHYFSTTDSDGNAAYVLDENRYSVPFDPSTTVPPTFDFLHEPQQFHGKMLTQQSMHGEPMDPATDTQSQGGSPYSALNDTEADVLTAQFGGQSVWRERTITEEQLTGDDFGYGESMRWESNFYPLNADGITPDYSHRVNVTTQFREEWFGDGYVNEGLGWNGGGMYELYSYEQQDPTTGEYVFVDGFMEYAASDGTRYTFQYFPTTQSTVGADYQHLNGQLTPGWYQYVPKRDTWITPNVQ